MNKCVMLKIHLFQGQKNSIGSKVKKHVLSYNHKKITKIRSLKINQKLKASDDY